ncbi:MAG TPA: hypothetical protein VGU71_21680 [Candidatus Dormibacteraeota bacterium]|nr:hypothetical protein [Candidatus Dormibacteraeota bacterium]
MIEIVRREVGHIPDWPYPQRVLRMHYNNNRLRSLGRKRGTYVDDPMWVLNQSIHDSRQSEGVGRKQKFEYDQTFFEEESRKRRSGLPG